MKKLLIIIFLIIVGYILFNIAEGDSRNLISPNLNVTKKQIIQQVTPAPPVAPKTIQFDSSTDLKQELDGVNPTVLDSDFE